MDPGQPDESSLHEMLRGSLAGAKMSGADHASRVLVLSAHETVLDRRIIAEVNTLTASGRHVTLVSIPTEVPEGCLDRDVRLIVPRTKSAIKRISLRRIAKRLPKPLYGMARTMWRLFCGSGSDGLYMDFFRNATPPEVYDVIHCHDLNTLPAAVELRGSICPKAKLIYDSHELYPFQIDDREYEQRWSAIERRHIGQADAVITINESVADELVRLYRIPKPDVIYNGYGMLRSVEPASEQEFLQHFAASGGRLKVFFHGSFTEGRNLHGLLKAAKLLGETVHLFLLGTGPIERSLKKLCRKQAIANAFFGRWVPQEELMRFVKNADLGVIPYLGSHALNNMYCTPNKLFEYLEAEVPVCASDLPELRKVIRSSVIGDVYPMDTPEAIARHR